MSLLTNFVITGATLYTIIYALTGAIVAVVVAKIMK